MNMKKAFKSSAKYPKSLTIKPIIFSAVAIIALAGCGSNNLPPKKDIKPLPPSHIKADKKNSEVEPPLGGVPPIELLKKR